MTAPPLVPVILLSGSVGVGKTAVLAEIHQILSELSVPHACVERDALACSWPAERRFNDVLALRNLRAVWANFRAAGATRLIIAGVVESFDDLEGYRRAVPGSSITTCRLMASEATRLHRLRSREHGAGLDWHLERTVKLEEILDAVRLEDFVVTNENQALRSVASEVLVRAKWIGADVLAHH